MVLFTEETALAPKIVRADAGDVLVMGPEVARVILSGADTNGAFLLVEAQIDAPHYGPPYHVHTMEDETFHVLSGELILIVDGVRHVLHAGDVAFAPRNVPHRFESGPDGVRMTVMASGTNFEAFYPRFADAMLAGEMERLPVIAAEHGIAFLPEPAAR